MEQYKQDFITFMVRSGVLTFGDFITKSGRKTPFFINTGKYTTGGQLARLGEYYAQSLVSTIGSEFDILYGPAYKGIPLVVTTAIALADKHHRSVPCCYNRKEAKDHGEGGSIIGHRVIAGDRIVIVDDVVTAGTSVRESVALLKKTADVVFSSLIVSVDRMERGSSDKSALVEIRESLGMKTFAIVTIDEIIAFLHNRTIDGAVVIDDAIRVRIEEYRKQYGCRAA
jgi:orotate phosphoribosyltransferase